jgi:hypothetical protein
MSVPFAESTVAVVTAADIRRALRLGRTATYALLRRAGARKVGERALRLPVGRLIGLLGEELARTVIEQAQAAADVEK